MGPGQYHISLQHHLTRCGYLEVLLADIPAECPRRLADSRHRTWARTPACVCRRLRTPAHARVRPPAGGPETLTTRPSITSAERQVIQASHVRGRAGAGALTPTSIRLDGRLPQQQVWPHVRSQGASTPSPRPLPPIYSPPRRPLSHNTKMMALGLIRSLTMTEAHLTSSTRDTSFS